MTAIACLLIATLLIAGGLVWILPAIALVLLSGVAIYYAWRQYSQSRWGMERKLYQQLVDRTRGDRNLAQKLIAYERQRTPTANRLQLLQNAIYRWDRDRSG
jgi:ABC-type nickel/cobalt efflux system permease component RcnA